MRTSLKAVVVLVAALLAACFDFRGSLDRCQGTGRCASETGAPEREVATKVDAGPEDAGLSFDCHAFSADSGWTVAKGFRAAVFASAEAGLATPVALTFAQGANGWRLYVVNQGNGRVLAIDPRTLEVRPLLFPNAPSLHES